MTIKECDRCHTKTVTTGFETTAENHQELSLYTLRTETKLKLEWGQVCRNCREIVLSKVKEVKERIMAKYERQAAEEIKAGLILDKLKS